MHSSAHPCHLSQLAEQRARDEAEEAERSGKVELRGTLKPKVDAWAAGKKASPDLEGGGGAAVGCWAHGCCVLFSAALSWLGRGRPLRGCLRCAGQAAELLC